MNQTHIDHKGCECIECWTKARDRHDALAVIRQAVIDGGDQILLGSINFHVEERMPLDWRMDFQKRHGSIMETYASYRQ
jgi:hypothetical protein